MEQIKISITGPDAEEQTARLMKAIYKTMARMDGRNCHITISSQREIPLNGEGEIEIPKFLQDKSRRQRIPALGRMG